MGWRAIKTHYDDGGISGGHMERPALQQLMRDIDAGFVNIVIVYKVDRLTRSLADFAKLVEKFDEHDVSFVSVTQAFNTSNSMGRLTLNVLLSFAQFKREVGAERVRDKIAASRRKGIWTGGKPPLGFDNIDKKLVVNEPEAEIVRKIYTLYEKTGCVRTIVRKADQNGWRSKLRKNGAGGNLLSRGPIYHMLKNPVYAGFMKTGDKLYEAQHDAIISQSQWGHVQNKLKERAQRSGPSHHKTSPLNGRLYWNDQRLAPDHTTKAGKRYRYYISRPGDQAHTRIRLKAGEVERVVSKTLSLWMEKTETMVNEIIQSGLDTATIQYIKDTAYKLLSSCKSYDHSDIPPLWVEGINRITLNETQIAICLNPQKLFNESALHKALKTAVTITRRCDLKKRGHEIRLILDEQTNAHTPDTTIINNLLLAHRLKTIRFDHPDRFWLNALKEENIGPSISHRFLRYAFLAPDIVEVILDGKIPIEMSSEALKILPELPACWDAQRQLFGMTSRSSTV